MRVAVVELLLYLLERKVARSCMPVYQDIRDCYDDTVLPFKLLGLWYLFDEGDDGDCPRAPKGHVIRVATQVVAKDRVNAAVCKGRGVGAGVSNQKTHTSAQCSFTHAMTT
jgi:hypothetical protein